MKFVINISTGLIPGKPFDNYETPKGAIFCQQMIEKHNLGNISPTDIRIDSCPYFLRAKEQDISLGNVNKVDMSYLVLSNPILSSISYFGASDTVKVIVPDGYLGLYATDVIRFNITGFDSDIIFSSLLNKFMKPKINYVDISFEFDAIKFLEDWIALKCPKFVGFTEEQYNSIVEAKVRQIKKSLDEIDIESA